MRPVSRLWRRLFHADAHPGLPVATRERLSDKARAQITEAAQQLLEGDTKNSEVSLAWAKQADEILEASQPARRMLLPATLVALVCLLLAGLGLWLPTSHIPVILQAELDEVSLQLLDDLAWQDQGLKIDAQRIRLTNLAELEAPGLEWNGQVDTLLLDRSHSQKGAQLRLQTLVASTGARLILHVTDYPRLAVKEGILTGRIEARDVRLMLKTSAKDQELSIQGPVPETLNFATRPSGTDPAQLMLESQQPWRIDGLRVQTLSLEKEEPPGSNRWVPSLRGGKLRLLETNKEIKLHRDDWLRLGQVEGQRLGISFDPKKPDSLQLQFHGTVEKLETGPTGFIRNLAPTWLEYLYHQQTLALFWSAVLFLWGMFWSLRKLW